MARYDYEAEPDPKLNAFCPHCAGWFATSTHPAAFRKLEFVDGVREVFYCTLPRDRGVNLIDAAAHGSLTPWQEWKRDQLIAEMEAVEREAGRLHKELNDYYDFNDGRF